MPQFRRDLIATIKDTPDDELRDLVSNLGGHDLPALLDVLNQADQVTDAPSVIFAYTIKGYGLPMAGDPLNHSLLLTQEQMDQVAGDLGDRPGRPVGRARSGVGGRQALPGSGGSTVEQPASRRRARYRHSRPRSTRAIRKPRRPRKRSAAR